MNGRKVFWVIAALNLFICGGILLYRAQAPSSKEALPILGAMKELSVLERSGQSFSLNDFKGKVWVFDFIYTSCTTQCPELGIKMSGLERRLPASVRLGSFSVDPTHDTPEVLEKYARQLKAKKDKWFFFTGDMDQIRNVLEDFHLAHGDNPEPHSLRLVLVDQQARIRGYYDSSDKRDMSRLVLDADWLSHE